MNEQMDKASVLGDAIRYVKELQERLKTLEENKNRDDVGSVVMVNKARLSYRDGCGRESLPRVEARVSEKDVLLRIHCQKQKGLLLKILVEIQNLHLFVVNSSVLSFGDSIIDITIVAQVKKSKCWLLLLLLIIYSDKWRPFFADGDGLQVDDKWACKEPTQGHFEIHVITLTCGAWTCGGGVGDNINNTSVHGCPKNYWNSDAGFCAPLLFISKGQKLYVTFYIYFFWCFN